MGDEFSVDVVETVDGKLTVFSFSCEEEFTSIEELDGVDGATSCATDMSAAKLNAFIRLLGSKSPGEFGLLDSMALVFGDLGASSILFSDLEL